MFRPVSAEEFVNSPSGEAFFRTYGAKADHRLVADTAQKMAIARWLTGNYNPATQLHTLYRGIDDSLAAAFNSHGALISRSVVNFGLGDTDRAARSMRAAANGRIAPHVAVLLDAAIAKNGEHPKELEDLAAGNPSADAIRRLTSQADALEASLQGGKAAYVAAVKAAGSDEVPPYREGTDLNNLTHSSIHFTTDRSFFRRPYQRSVYSHVITLQFEPGTIAAAPKIGDVDGEFIWPDNGDIYPGYECEWYALGKVAVCTPGVSLELSPL